MTRRESQGQRLSEALREQYRRAERRAEAAERVDAMLAEVERRNAIGRAAVERYRREQQVPRPCGCGCGRMIPAAIDGSEAGR
jgi:hypothetical protein